MVSDVSFKGSRHFICLSPFAHELCHLTPLQLNMDLSGLRFKTAEVSLIFYFWSAKAFGPPGLNECRNWQRTLTILSNNGVKCRSSHDVISFLCTAHHFAAAPYEPSWRCRFFPHLSFHARIRHTRLGRLILGWMCPDVCFKASSWSYSSNLQSDLQLRISHEGAPLSGNRRFPFADWGNVCMSSRNSAAAYTSLLFSSQSTLCYHVQVVKFPSWW